MIEQATRQEIDKVAWKILREAGVVKPPVPIGALLDHLHLYREFYDLRNPGILDRAKHKIRVGGARLAEILQKVNLVAVLLSDEKRIIVNSELPERKRDGPSFHEVTHRILGWHRPYFLAIRRKH